MASPDAFGLRHFDLQKSEAKEATKMQFNKILLTVLAAMVIAILSANLDAQEMVIDGLIGFWTFDKTTIAGKTVKDLLGNHDGTINGAPEIVAGKIGDALSFDGKDDFVEVKYSESLDLKEAITIEFWFLLKGKSGDNEYPRPVSKGQSTSDNSGYGVWVKDVSGPTDIGFRSVTLAPNDIRAQNVPNYDDDAWHHVMLTYDGKKGKLFVDGNKLVDIDVSGEISQNEEPLHIGDGKNERHFNGLIDEVRIYNQGLSEAEVKQNYEVKSNLLAIEPTGRLTTTWSKIKLGF